MERKQNISQYRGRLDETLGSHDLANEEKLKTLVKNQMLRSSDCEMEEYIDNVVEKRTKEVSNFLQMLKSASLSNDDGSKTHRSWKVKQDTEEYRVMYREGPEGTPFHTLLVEGYVDGPADVCLCISWESALYKKWWPQSTIPTFKILASECLQKVRMGEQISLVRMKVSWPLSTREAIVHFFEFEYFQDGLIIVLINSISDLESVDRSTHGFTRDGIPDVQDVVRIDVVGGFAIQKVDAGRSYFRTIATMDIKLDFVPPSLINFISRQLIGSGFKLYQKEVASVSKGDEEFGKVLRDPVYARIREALYSDNYLNGSVELENCKSEPTILPEEHVAKSMQAEAGKTDEEILSEKPATEPFLEHRVLPDNKACGEIEEIKEEEIDKNGHSEQDHKEFFIPTTNGIAEKYHVSYKKKAAISPDVKQALETLEKAILFMREHGVTAHTRSLQCLGNEESLGLVKGAVNDTKNSEDGQICSNSVVVGDEVSKDKVVDRNLNEPRNSPNSLGSRHTVSNSYSREANHKMIVPASPEVVVPCTSKTQQTVLCSSNIGTNGVPILNRSTNGNKLLVNANVDGIDKDSPNKGNPNVEDGVGKNSPNNGKNKTMRFCCLHFISG